jgi:AraC-like DNA-binding protein
MAVTKELDNLGIEAKFVGMGEVTLSKMPTEKQLVSLAERLKELGFELLDNARQKQIEKIKTLLIKKVQSGEIEEHFSLSDFLSKALHKDYPSISRLFSAVTGTTIEQFFILQKIEKVKEWLAYEELTLSEIAWKLGYSSVAHLSAQFKKVTGLSSGDFKKMGGHRKSLDQLSN